MSNRPDSWPRMVAARESFVTNANTTRKYGTPRYRPPRKRRQQQGQPAGSKPWPKKTKATSKVIASGSQPTSSIPLSATSGPKAEPHAGKVEREQQGLADEVGKINQTAPSSSPVTSTKIPSAPSRHRPSTMLYVPPPLRKKLLQQQQSSMLDSTGSSVSESDSLHQPAGRRAPPGSQHQTRGHSEQKPSNLRNEVTLSSNKLQIQTHPAKNLPIGMSPPVHTNQQG